MHGAKETSSPMDLFDEKITEIEDIEKKKILVSNVYLMMNKIILCQVC